MKILTRTALLVGALLLPAVTLAQTADKAAAPAQQQTAIATVKVPELNEEQLDAWIGKLNTYTKLYNNSRRALDSWKRYKSWVNVKTGPTGKERVVYGLYSISDSLTKQDAPAAVVASRLEPKMGALDDAAANFADALVKLDPVLREAYGYYERKDYSDDKFAKGKELHPRLVEAFGNVEKTYAAFDAEFSSVKAQIDVQSLNNIEKTEGKKYRWYMKRTMMASRAAIEALQEVNSKADIPALSEAIKSYAVIVREFDEYVETATDLPIAFTAKSGPAGILSKLREARDALEKNNITWFNNYSNSAVSEYNTMVTFAR